MDVIAIKTVYHVDDGALWRCGGETFVVSPVHVSSRAHHVHRRVDQIEVETRGSCYVLPPTAASRTVAPSDLEEARRAIDWV